MKVLAAMLLSVIMLSSGFMINSPAIAEPNENANDNAKRTFKLPDNAIEIAPGVFHIGTAIHEGKVVDGIAIVSHKSKHNPGGPGGGPGGNGGGEDCFAFFGKGVKWKVLEDYLVDPTNSVGLNEQAVKDNIAAAITVWEDSAGSDILGNLASGPVDGIAEDEPDGKNEVLFGNVDIDGAIAVNIIWGIFDAPKPFNEIVEWDQMYDQADFDWSLIGEAGKMDFLNIASHEVGHATGMAHPADSCTEETMYRFAVEGETKKQDLNAGDIAGIKKLY